MLALQRTRLPGGATAIPIALPLVVRAKREAKPKERFADQYATIPPEKVANRG